MSQGPPMLSAPVQVAALAASTSSVAEQRQLAATASSSASAPRQVNDGFALGTAVKLGPNGSIRRSKGLATYVASGEGVVLIDPLTQTPKASYAISPSFHPLTPPLVIVGPTSRCTYIVVSPRHSSAEAELHAWVESKQSSGHATSDGRTASTSTSASSLGTTTLKQTCKVEGNVVSLHALASGEVLLSHDDGSQSIVAISSSKGEGSGGESRISVERLIAASAPGEAVHMHHLSILDRGAAASLLRPLTNGSTKDVVGVVVQFVSKRAQKASEAEEGKAQKTKKKKGKRMSATEVIDAAEDEQKSTMSTGQGAITMRLQMIRAGSKERSITLAEKDVQGAFGIEDASQVVDFAFHHHGRAALLTRDGAMRTTTFSTTSNKDIGSLPSAAVQLPGFSGNLSHSVALQLLTTSYLVVVGSLSASSSASSSQLLPRASNAVSLLVDVELGAVLSEQIVDLSLEQTTEAPASHFSTRIGGSMALLASIPSNKITSRSRKGVSLWAQPFEVPEGGSQLLWAMAKSDLTRKWTSENAASESTAPHVIGANAKDEETALVERLRHMSHEKTKDDKMDEAYLAWWRATQSGSSLARNTETVFTHKFVSEVLASALPFASTPSSPYGRKAVHHLLSAGVVSNSMCPELVAGLEAQDDWDALLLAMAKVSDIGEAECVRLLARSLRQDTPTTPSLERVLAVLVAVPFSRPVFRRALRDEIQTQEDVSALLEQGCRWLSLLTSSSAPLSLSGQREVASSPTSDLPELQDVLLFLTDLFDAHFPLLLSSSSLSSNLASVKAAIDEHLSWVDAVAPLRGPLGAFGKLQEDQKRSVEMLEARKQRALGASGGARQSSSSKKKTWISNSSAAAGMDQGKEARIAKRAPNSLGGPKVGISETGGGLGSVKKSLGGAGAGEGGEAGKSARIQRMETSALMGPYVREKFYL